MISVAGGDTSHGEMKFRYPPTAKLAEGLGRHGANPRRGGASASVTTGGFTISPPILTPSTLQISHLTSHFTYF
jgi:hypothetical protein